MATEKRLIRLNDALKAVSTEYLEGTLPEHDLALLLTTRRKLKALPTVDAVEVVRGHWIERQAVKGEVYCSECATIEKVTDSNYKSRRCPNCGAMMDGGDDNG